MSSLHHNHTHSVLQSFIFSFKTVPSLLWLVHSENKRLVSGASLAASEASPPGSSSLWSALSWPIRGLDRWHQPIRSQGAPIFSSDSLPCYSQCANSVQKENCSQGAMQTTKAEMCNSVEYHYEGSHFIYHLITARFSNQFSSFSRYDSRSWITIKTFYWSWQCDLNCCLGSDVASTFHCHRSLNHEAKQ